MPTDTEPSCPSCGQPVLEIDVRCKACGTSLNSTGSQRMIGQVVLGQYELVDVLGQGGMSVVYQGRHRITDQQVALKILPPELAAHSQVKSRFLEEAKALAQLDHPNIVHLYNFGQENGSFVLAMQFVIGKTWERLIVESQRLSWQASARIAVDVLRALEYAHGRGVIHRDMKPSNVLVREQDGAATVMDFGIAKMTTSSRLTATGQTMGTVRYMSPEQVRGQEVDATTDLYSLGATIYESLTGETPFDGSTHFEIMSKHLTDVPQPPSERGVELPPELEQGLLRCLAKKPAQRFASAREVRKLFEAVLREHDAAGLSETQPVSRELLGEQPAERLRLPKLPPAVQAPGSATAAGATASPLPSATAAASLDREFAHELSRNLDRKAGSDEESAKGGRRWGVLAGALAVLVAGGAAAAVMLTRGGGGEAESAQWEPEVGHLTQRQRFDELGLWVRTPDHVAPAAVAAAFGDAWDAFGAYLRERGFTEELPRVVKVIAALPREAMCAPSTYWGVSPPANCATAVHAFRVGDHILVVTDDVADWPRAMRLGIPEAACAAGLLGSKICTLAMEFSTDVASEAAPEAAPAPAPRPAVPPKKK